MPASGHQDHTTFPSASRAVRQQHISVHRILSRVRDDRERPSGGQDGGACRSDLGNSKSRIFLQARLDNGIADLPGGPAAQQIGQRCKPIDAMHAEIRSDMVAGWIVYAVLLILFMISFL
jgi:hypothetical protein